MIAFRNRETNEIVYSPVCRRGNRQYALKKARQRDEFLKALDNKVLDYPAGNNPNYRMTCALFMTLTFDKKRNNREDSWESLSSTEIEGSDLKTGALNNLCANLQDIFGNLCKIVVKEAQDDGYPAPHIIILLKEPVLVKLHKGKYGETWRIADPHILKRLGKDSALRRLSKTNHSEAIEQNPIWKYGFMDIQGIVKGDRFRNRKSAISYAYKYLTKSLVDDHGSELEDIETINECKTKSLRIALWGHFANKSFGLRDITYGKKVKEYLEMLPDEVEEEKEKTPRWVYLRSVPRFIYEDIIDCNLKRIRKQCEIYTDPPPDC